VDFSKVTLSELACFVYETLKAHDIDVVLVGGACVSIYSENRYQSMDADFATYAELKSIEKVLQKFGFKRMGRCFSHANCPYVIDPIDTRKLRPSGRG
jgi:glycerate kinase